MAPHLYRHVPIPHITATAILIAGVITTVVSLNTDVFEDSHGGRVTTAPLHPPHNRHVLFRYPLSAYLVSSSTCWKPSAPNVRKRHWQSTQEGSSGGVCLCCWDLLLYNVPQYLVEMMEEFESKSAGCWSKYRLVPGDWDPYETRDVSFEHKESIQTQIQVSSSLSKTSMPVKNC